MDYDNHMRAPMHASMCNVVNYDGEGHSGSMMALMTTDQATDSDHHRRHPVHEQQHTQHQHSTHESRSQKQQAPSNHRQQLSILQSNTASSASLPPSSFTFYNPAIVEPYLQSALLQGTHGFDQSHNVDTHPPIISALDQLEPGSIVLPADEEKPDIGEPKIAQGTQLPGRDCNFGMTSTVRGLLVGSRTDSITLESRCGVGPTSMDMESSYSVAGHGDPVKAKIISHPAYPRLVIAYVNCHKIGAPAEVVTSLDEVSKKYQSFRSSSPASMGADPELDHFMETYCNVLQKYHDEVMHPYKEAMAFFRKIELQLNTLSKAGTLRLSQYSGDDKAEPNGNGSARHNNNNNINNNGGSSVDDEVEEEGDASCGEVDFHEEMIDPLAEDQKLKEQLLRKYSGYICSLKQEFLKKKKKGKLPKEARQKLLEWWSQHYKWPYPSETEKAGLAESTGLDQKQINNWFINQRKRHWKPTEDMPYVMVESPTVHHHHHHQHVHTHPHLAPHPLASYAVVETMDAAAAAAAATIMPGLQ